MAGTDAMRKGYHDLPRREILDLIPFNAKRVLDLGCGTGALGKALKERQGCHVTGIELNKEALKTAKINLDICLCDNLNRYDPTFVNVKYDCIIFADILEHLVSPWAVLKKFASVLTDDGVVIASIPNVAHFWILKNLEQGLFRYEPAGLLDITHLRFFTRTSIFQLFYTAGLKIVSCNTHPSDKNPYQYHVTAVKPVVKHREPITTILILTFNGWEYTKQCIDSIKKKTQEPYRILVIDNGSTDGTVEELRKDKTLFHIENSHNLGFSKGFNVGLMVVETPYFVLSNSDVVVTKNWLMHMIAHIKLNKDLVILGPRSNYISGPQVIKDCQYQNDIQLDIFAKGLLKYDDNPLVYCPRIVFFFTLFKSIVLQRVGFLDEIFGKGNFEDDDYCMRVARKKFKSAFDNTVFIHHYGSKSFKKNPQEFKELLEVNGQKFMKKWGYNNINEYYEYLRGGKL